VPGSLPVSAPAWRAQQFRWTKGFAQCALKLTPMVWRSAELPLWQKLLVTLQMSQPLAFVLGALCTLLGLPFISGAATAGPVLMAAAVWASVAGICGSLGFLALGVTRETAPGAAREIVGSLFLTTGLLISNARAGLEALLGHRSEFVRTPKTAAARGKRRIYGLIEVGAGLGLLTFALSEQPLAVFYLTLVIGGLLSLGLMQLFDGRDPLKHATRIRKAA
jgi:hypothetical protein